MKYVLTQCVWTQSVRNAALETAEVIENDLKVQN